MTSHSAHLGLAMAVCGMGCALLSAACDPPRQDVAAGGKSPAPRHRPNAASIGAQESGLQPAPRAADKACVRHGSDVAHGWFTLQAFDGTPDGQHSCIARAGGYDLRFECGMRVIEVELRASVRTTLIGEPRFPSDLRVLVRKWQDADGSGLCVIAEEAHGPIKRGDILFASSSGVRAQPRDRPDFFAPLSIFALHDKSGITFSHLGRYTAVDSQADCVGADQALYYLVMGTGFMAYSIHFPLD